MRFMMLMIPGVYQGGKKLAENFAPDAETVYLLLEHLAANGRAKIAGEGDPGKITFCKP